MENVKKVLINSYSPHAFSKNYENSWDDVWLVFHNGRKVVKLGPCVMSRGYVESELADSEEAFAEHLAKGDLVEESDFCEMKVPIDHAELAKAYREDAEECHSVMERLNAGAEFVVFGNEDEGTPELCLREEKLTRGVIERGLEKYLRSRGYVKLGSRLKFVWRRPKFLIRSFPE